MISRRIKFAAVAAMAVAIMLPVSYGAVKAIRKLFVTRDQVTFEYPQPDGKEAASYVFTRTLAVPGADAADREKARVRLEEFFQLYREGKAKEVEPGVWQATLADGEEFAYRGDPEKGGVEFTEEEKARLKQMADEINELRKAGKGERTFWKETEANGLRIRLYHVRYTLLNGEVVTLCEGELAK